MIEYTLLRSNIESSQTSHMRNIPIIIKILCQKIFRSSDINFKGLLLCYIGFVISFVGVCEPTSDLFCLFIYFFDSFEFDHSYIYIYIYIIHIYISFIYIYSYIYIIHIYIYIYHSYENIIHHSMKQVLSQE